MQKTKPGSRLAFTGSVFCLLLLPALIVAITFTALSADGLCSPSPSSSESPANLAAPWTPQEKEAWKHICAGEPADMELIESGADKRTVSLKFLSDILLDKKYSKAIGPKGVHFIGAIFNEEIALSHSRLDFPLVFEKCTFADKVDLSYITCPCEVRILGSAFADDVDIGGAQIDGSLRITGSGGAQPHAPWTPSRFAGDLILRNARINGQVFIGYATFAKDLKMEGLRTDTFLQMTAVKCDGNITLRSARPAQVIIEGGTFAGDMEMQSLDVDGDINIYGKTQPPKFQKEVNLAGSRISGGLYFSQGAAAKVDLSGTEINGELRFDPAFIEQPKSLELILGNAQIGNLSFPPTVGEVSRLDLIGCEYSRLNWIDVKTGLLYDISWFWNQNPKEAMKWVEKGALAPDPSPGPGMRYYSAQPYQQLAGVLKQGGRTDLANDVLFASKEAERNSSVRWQWWLLTMQRYIIGYGYEYRFVLFSTSIFIIVGYFMIWANAEGKKHSKAWRLVYSVDMLLPILQLEKTNYDIHLNGCARYYFYFHKAAGYLLASFLIAGISGLTK